AWDNKMELVHCRQVGPACRGGPQLCRRPRSRPAGRTYGARPKSRRDLSMSIAFVCYSCGNRLEVAEYTRKKIRCPHCGVMCEVPLPSGTAPSEEPAAQPRSEPRRRAAMARNDALQP